MKIYFFDKLIFLFAILEKPASLSSVYHDSLGGFHTANFAVDGIHLPPAENEKLSIAHTGYEENPWLRVNLEKSHCIWAVRILNRERKFS